MIPAVCLNCHRPAVACRCRPVAHPPPSTALRTGFCLCGHDRGTHPGAMGGVCQSCECLAYQPEDTRPGVPEAMRRALAAPSSDEIHIVGSRPDLPCCAEEGRRAQLRADLRAFEAIAPLDELELLVELAHRIESGRRVYGEWTAASEKRDLVQEEHEEHLDGLVYSSMRRVRARRMGDDHG